MTTKRVSLKELAKDLPDFSKATLAKQKNAIIMGLQRSIPMLVQKSPVDTGLYAQSWSMSVDEEKAVIGNFAPHAPIIENGMRSGHWIPLAPLLAWAKRVLKDGSQPPNYSSHVWALAKYTQKKIHDKGIDPRLVLTNALPDIIKNIKAEFERLK